MSNKSSAQRYTHEVALVKGGPDCTTMIARQREALRRYEQVGYELVSVAYECGGAVLHFKRPVSLAHIALPPEA